MEYNEQLTIAEKELVGWVNRWQDESDLGPLDLVALLETMKLQLYYNYWSNERKDE